MKTSPIELASASNTLPRQKYQVVKKLAIGGMAEIFLARVSGIEGFEKYVVLKKLLPERAAKAKAVQMFLDEARLAAQLHHHNIAQVYDIGQAGGEYFIAMEYLHGQDVRSVFKRTIRKGRELPLQHALSITAGVAAGLHYAHSKVSPNGRPLDIVHRDVSPSNIFVTYDGGVKLVDFGIARAAERTVQTREGGLKGKIRYMAPEQVKGGAVDRRSDIFALGVVLYELSTMTRLFGTKDDDDFTVMERIVRRPIPRPSSRRPDYPAELETIVMRALAKEPEERYASAQDFLMAVEHFAAAAQLPLSSSALAGFIHELFGAPREPEITGSYRRVEDSLDSVESIGGFNGLAGLAAVEKQRRRRQSGIEHASTKLLDRDRRPDPLDFEKTEVSETNPSESGLHDGGYVDTATGSAVRVSPDLTPSGHGLKLPTTADPVSLASGSWSRVDLSPRRRSWRIAAVTVAVLGIAAAVFFGLRDQERTAQETPPGQGEPAAAAVVDSPVTVRFEISPPGARIELDGVAVDGARITLERSSKARSVTIAAPGFEPVTETVIADSDKSVVVSLEPARPSAGSKENDGRASPGVERGDGAAGQSAGEAAAAPPERARRKRRAKRKSQRKRARDPRKSADRKPAGDDEKDSKKVRESTLIDREW